MSLGSVQTSAISVVLPAGLCTGLTEVLEVAVSGNEYHDGTLQRARRVDTSRRRWRFSRRLTGDELAALRTFWEDRKGAAEAFWFYHPKEGTWDGTGAAVAGRYVVRFGSEWSETVGMARSGAGLELVEVV